MRWRAGRPDHNTDHDSEFTSFAFFAVLKDGGIRIGMDGWGRWMNSVFIDAGGDR